MNENSFKLYNYIFKFLRKFLFIHVALTSFLIRICSFQGIKAGYAAQQGTASTWDDALLHRRPSGIQRISHAVLLLIDLDVTGSPNLKMRDRAVILPKRRTL